MAVGTGSAELPHLCHWPPVFAVTHNKGWQAKAACLVDDQLLVQTLEATAQRHQPTVRRPRDRGDTRDDFYQAQEAATRTK